MINIYIKKSCPFSLKVLSFIEEINQTNSINVLVCDNQYQNTHSIKLKKMGGKSQVPCLNIGDMWIYESDSIIEKLQQEFNNFSNTPITDYTTLVFNKFIELKKKIEKTETVS